MNKLKTILQAIIIFSFLLLSRITFGQNTKDTSKAKGINSTTVIGNNNHVVGGSGNIVAVNGDVHINTEILLDNKSLQRIGDEVNNLIVNYKFENSVSVITESTCNQTQVSKQIIDYLKQRRINAGEAFIMGINTKEIKIDTSHRFSFQKRQIKIFVGRFN